MRCISSFTIGKKSGKLEENSKPDDTSGRPHKPSKNPLDKPATADRVPAPKARPRNSENGHDSTPSYDTIPEDESLKFAKSNLPGPENIEPPSPTEEPLSVSMARKEDFVCCNGHPIYKADPLAFYVFFEKLRHHNRRTRFRGSNRNQYIADDYIKERLELTPTQIKLAQYRETQGFMYHTAPQDHDLPLGQGAPDPWMMRMRCILLNMVNRLDIIGGDVRIWGSNQSRVDFFNQECFSQDRRACLNPDQPLDRSNIKGMYEAWDLMSRTRFERDDAFLRTRKGKGPTTGYHYDKNVASKWRIKIPDHKDRFATRDGMKHPSPYMHNTRNYIKKPTNIAPEPGVYRTTFAIQSDLQVVFKILLFHENVDFNSSPRQIYKFNCVRRYRVVAALFAGAADGTISAKTQEELRYPPTMTIEASIPIRHIDKSNRIRYSDHWRPCWLDVVMALKEASLQWGADGRILDISTTSGNQYQQLDATDQTGVFTVGEVANQYPSVWPDQVPASSELLCRDTLTCSLGWQLTSRVDRGV